MPSMWTVTVRLTNARSSSSTRRDLLTLEVVHLVCLFRLQRDLCADTAHTPSLPHLECADMLCGAAGTDSDSENVTKILDYVQCLPELHAIVLVVNGSNPRLTTDVVHTFNLLKGSLPDSVTSNTMAVVTMCNALTWCEVPYPTCNLPWQLPLLTTNLRL